MINSHELLELKKVAADYSVFIISKFDPTVMSHLITLAASNKTVTDLCYDSSDYQHVLESIKELSDDKS